MYYIGFFADSVQNALVFRSDVTPSKTKYKFFKRVMGPYGTMQEAKYILKVVRRRSSSCAQCGVKHLLANPCGNSKKRRKKNPSIRKQVPVYLADRKTLVGYVSSSATSVGAAKLAKVKSCEFANVNGIYAWVVSKKNPYDLVSAKKALALTEKVIRHAKEVYKEGREIYQGNPGEAHHHKLFIRYMRELEKYALGSTQYIATLARAYENLEAAQESSLKGIR